MPVASPRIGVAVGWYDPENPRVWSGVPHALVQQVRRLATYAGHRDAIPSRPLARAVRWSLARTGRLDDGWVLSRPMRAVAAMTAVSRRVSTGRGADGWVQLVGSFGRIVGGPYVTVFEVAPSQLLADDRWWTSFGYPGATPARMRWVAAQQLAAHRRAQACCAASRWAADGLVRDGVDPRKVHVVGYGANVALSAPPQRQWDTPRFLFVGRDWQRKNGDAVVRAFRRLRAEVPSAQLDLVGHHPAIDEPGVRGHGPLSLYDEATRQQAEQLFARATCFVVPSHLEPFGIVYVEAARAGIASIGTTAGGTDTSIGTAGVRVDPDDDDALYRAMRHLADPEVAAERGDAAYRHAQQLTWAAFGERVLRSMHWLQFPAQPLADFL